MKNIAIIILLIGGLFMSSVATAQKAELSKEEQKKLKKQKKDMDPMKFKELYEGYQQLKRESEALQRQITNMGKVATDKQTHIDHLKSQLDSIRQASAIGAGGSGGGSGVNEDYSKGLVYKVQVGDLKEKSLDRKVFQQEGKDFAVEKDDNGKLKYTLGYFRNYWEAIEFKDHLIKIGIKTAYAVAYKDGKLTGMKEARAEDNR